MKIQKLNEDIEKFLNSYIVYHCSNKDFDKFNSSYIGTNSDDGIWGRGIYFGNVPNTSYGKIIYKCNIIMNNPFYVNDYHSPEEIGDYLDVSPSNFRMENGYNIPFFSQSQMRQITSQIKEKGHDGVIVSLTPKWIEYVVFNPENIKILEKVK